MRENLGALEGHGFDMNFLFMLLGLDSVKDAITRMKYNGKESVLSGWSRYDYCRYILLLLTKCHTKYACGSKLNE